MQRNPNKKRITLFFNTYCKFFLIFHSLRERVKKQEQIYVYYDNIL
ncbi:hypothetical protein HMPREF2534_01263 [Bacteroides thetaiotaomicron]|nr:hypothetical protein HMPREF2534_01263 [Bacteroides thetaiotaomicron]